MYSQEEVPQLHSEGSVPAQWMERKHYCILLLSFMNSPTKSHSTHLLWTMLVPRTLAEGKDNLSGQESKQIAQDRENNIRERGPSWLKLKRNLSGRGMWRATRAWLAKDWPGKVLNNCGFGENELAVSYARLLVFLSEA